jgi:hypothetical protein
MTDADVEHVLMIATPDVRELAERTMKVVREVLPPDIVESVDGTDIGYGWTSGYQGLIFVIGIHAKWVNLGIADGAMLPAPKGLLHGSGKRHRYVRIAAAEDLETPGLRDLLEAAVKAHPRPS